MKSRKEKEIHEIDGGILVLLVQKEVMMGC